MYVSLSYLPQQSEAFAVVYLVHSESTTNTRMYNNTCGKKKQQRSITPIQVNGTPQT